MVTSLVGRSLAVGVLCDNRTPPAD